MGPLRLAMWPNDGTFIAIRKSETRRVASASVYVAVNAALEGVMDVGITKSNKNSPFHFVSGMVIVTVGYSALMFAVRAMVMGS